MFYFFRLLFILLRNTVSCFRTFFFSRILDYNKVDFSISGMIISEITVHVNECSLTHPSAHPLSAYLLSPARTMLLCLYKGGPEETPSLCSWGGNRGGWQRLIKHSGSKHSTGKKRGVHLRWRFRGRGATTLRPGRPRWGGTVRSESEGNWTLYVGQTALRGASWLRVQDRRERHRHVWGPRCWEHVAGGQEGAGTASNGW